MINTLVSCLPLSLAMSVAPAGVQADEPLDERLGLSVCVAKNSDFVGQTFVSGEFPKPDLVAVTDALAKCVEWSAKDLAHRDPAKCYIAACSPVVLVDGDTIAEILANLIAQIIGP